MGRTINKEKSKMKLEIKLEIKFDKTSLDEKKVIMFFSKIIDVYNIIWKREFLSNFALFKK